LDSKKFGSLTCLAWKVCVLHMDQSLNITENSVAAGHTMVPDDKLRHWGKLLAKFVSVQIFVQAVGLVSGILLIRNLSQTEYAYFTIANSMQAMLILLADVGVSSALSGIGGKVWQDKARFGALIVAGMQVRKSLVVVSVILVTPVLCWLLISNRANPISAVAITVCVLLGVNFRLTNDVLRIVPQLHARVDQLQRMDLYASLLRMVLIMAACLLFVNAAVAILVASVSFGLQNLMVRKWAAEGADLTAPPLAEDRRAIFTVIRQQSPTVIYYCVQGQLTVFLISVFGTTKTIAEVGALSRLQVLFSLVTSVMTSIVLPRFARCQDRARFKTMYLQVMFGFACLSTFLVLVAYLLPTPFLWVLGSKYAYLNKELVYVVFMTVVNVFVGAIYTINASKAWMRGAWVSIPITIAGQLLLVPLVNLSTVRGVVLFSCLPTIPGVLPYLYRACQEIKRMD
jgi:O-antigen/teichoic acid export membrane protein